MLYASGFWSRFDYDIINRTKEQIKDFEENVKRWLDVLLEDIDCNDWRKNEGACISYGRCEFSDLCKSLDDETILDNLYERFDAYKYLKGID